MGIFRTLFRRNREIIVIARPQTVAGTPISSVRRRYLLLGQEYSVQLSMGERNSLKIEGAVFRVTLKEMTRENFETFMEGWYRRTARKIFQKTMDDLDVDGIKPRIKLFKMRRAWGRCYYQKRVVTLNLYLIKTPLPCIEYIVLHELCHFTHNNHSRDFHELVALRDPEWKSKDKLLKDFTRARATLLQRLHI